MNAQDLKDLHILAEEIKRNLEEIQSAKDVAGPKLNHYTVDVVPDDLKIVIDAYYLFPKPIKYITCNYNIKGVDDV